MHNWVLVDIIEVYEKVPHSLLPIVNKQFKEHEYLLFCDDCNSIRTVKESTFNKMIKLGLIEEQVTV